MIFIYKLSIIVRITLKQSGSCVSVRIFYSCIVVFLRLLLKYEKLCGIMIIILILCVEMIL